MTTLRRLLVFVLASTALTLGACSDDSTPTPDPDGALPADGGSPEVDTLAPDQGPAPDTTPPPKLCEHAEPLTVQDGSARVVRTATWLLPLTAEPQCAGSAPAAAPKMLFKVSATKGQWYRVHLDTRFAAHMYLFTDATCTVAAIEADCKSGDRGEMVGPIAAGKAGLAYLEAPNDGDLYIVIKAAEENPASFFALSVEEIEAPTNGTCSSATALTFFNGKASVTGDTQAKLTPDEFSGLRCGGSDDLDGPQAYYSFSAKKGTSYKITANPTFKGSLYIFSAASSCTQADLEADCASKGQKGDVYSLEAGKANDVYFIAPADGDYKIAVDSDDPAAAGSFSLGVEEDVIEPPDNYQCANAKAVTFSGSPVTFNATTIGGFNEHGTDVDCGGFTDFEGPQVYYKLSVMANKAYKVSLTPKFDAYLYVFSGASCGTASAINSDCNSDGVSGAKSAQVSAGETRTLFFRPKTAGDYLVTVDSGSDTDLGNFDITFEEIDPPQNDTCTAAEAVSLSGGSATVTAASAFALDELSTLRCGGSTDLDGPQLYYSVALTKDKLYKLELSPAFSNAFLYLFRRSVGCTQTAVEADCASGGVDGGMTGPIGGAAAGAIYIVPKVSEDYIFVVDSSAPSAFGDFTVTITESTPANNTTCAAAQQLPLTNNTASAIGVTVGAANEFGTSVSCGKTALAGGQNYFKVSMKASTDYFISLTADFKASLYVFGASANCSVTAINSDCGSGGTSGDIAALGTTGSTALAFRATTAGDRIIAVDSNALGDAGGYTLTVTEVVPPTGPRLVISEINVGSDDYVVLRNAGTADASLNNVQFLLYQSVGGIAKPDNNITLPNQILAAGASLYLVEKNPPTMPGDIYIGTNIFYGGGSDFAALLCQGPCSTPSNVIDYATFGSAATPAPAGVTFAGGPVSGLSFSNEDTHSYTRATFLGQFPTFSQSDWTVAPASR